MKPLAPLFLVLGLAVSLAAAPPVDDAFALYWRAASVAEAAKAAAAVVASGVSFDDAYARLRSGRTYLAGVPRGVQALSRHTGTIDFPYTIDVPATYDPAKKYQVRVQLHGGVMRPDPAARGDGSIGALAGADQIYILPRSWAEAQWWAPAQDENLPAILDSVKRTYNVDENRVVLSGVSDGGTAAFYVAMRDTTPYASFLPLNGHIMVLANRDLGLRGALFPQNLVNKPFFIVNGGKDRLYPAASVEPLLTDFKNRGLDLIYKPQPEAGHNTAWWPEVKDSFEAFVREHPRTPHPVRLTWQTDNTTMRNRAHWLVIDRLGNARPGTELPDLNDIQSGEEENFGVRSIGMRITSVLRGSNAEAFGFRATDTVRSINGRDLPLGLELTEFMGLFKAGDALHFVIERGQETVDAKGVYQPTVMPRVRQIFATGLPTGRVDLVREGNTVRASARGVGAFTLLLSPDVFDFSRPVTVVVDGKTLFDGMVKKSVDTLMTWAARDNDRTMLYGAALKVVVTP